MENTDWGYYDRLLPRQIEEIFKIRRLPICPEVLWNFMKNITLLVLTPVKHITYVPIWQRRREENDAIDAIRATMDMGISPFRTAPQYGAFQQDGVVEMVLEKALKGNRNKMLTSSKFGRNPSIKSCKPQFNR